MAARAPGTPEPPAGAGGTRDAEDFAPLSTPPSAAASAWRREQVLWWGFVVCLAIGVATVVLPELSSGDGDASHKRPQPAPAK